MKTLIALPLAAILLLLTHNASMAQESEWPDLQLKDGIAGEDYSIYRTNLLRVLQKEIGSFQVSYAQPNPDGFTWELADGQLPAGLVIEKNGDVSGVPVRAAVRDLPYVFRVRFSDREFAKEVNVIMRISMPHLVLRRTNLQKNFRSESVGSASADAPRAEEVGNSLASGPAIELNESVVQQERDKNADKIVEQLTKALQNKEAPADVRKHAAIYLSRLGPQALTALPALMAALNDKDEGVSKAASNAIDHIQTVSGETSSFSVSGSVTDDTGEKIPHVSIQVEGEGRELTTESDNDGNYEIGPLATGSYTLRANPDEKYYFTITEELPPAEGSNLPFEIHLKSKQILRGGQFSRVVLGYEQAGASASNSSQKFFMDLFLSTPLGVSRNPKGDRYEPRWRLWGDARITSVPQQNLATAGNSTVRDFAQNFGSRFFDLKVNEVAQAAEVTAGVEYRLWGSDTLLPSTPLGTKNRFSVSLIAGGGMITPLTPRDTSAVFSVDKSISPDVFKEFKLPDTTKFVAFVNPDRDRFFRQYYGGLRLKTTYFDAGGRDIARNPGTLDLTFGQNEAITGGRLRGGVMRMDGFFPLPIEKAKYVFLFGTALMRLTRTRISDPLILSAAASGTPVPGPDTAIITVPQTNRDYYKIGVGIDPIGLIKCLVHSCSATPN